MQLFSCNTAEPRVHRGRRQCAGQVRPSPLGDGRRPGHDHFGSGRVRVNDARWATLCSRVQPMTVDREAPEELPEQLAEILRAQIESGELPPRTKLMPQLDMVQHYGVSRGTVAKATDLLADEGLVRWVKGRCLWTADPAVIETWRKERAKQRRKNPLRT